MRRFLTALTVCVGMALPAAHAATVLNGDLYFTTFQNQSGTVLPLTTNVWKVAFIYDITGGTRTLCIGTTSLPCLAGDPFAVTSPPTTAIKTLTGADGLLFDPNDATLKTLLIGEQNSNLVAQMSTDGTVLLEKKADGASGSGYLSGQAYGLASTPDKTKLLTLMNDTGFGSTSVNVSPLGPVLGNGVAHPVSGLDESIRGIAFIGSTAYYGNAADLLLGYIGTIDISAFTFTTTRSTIIDDVNPGTPTANGFLPTHGMTFDPFSGCIIASSSNQIWQLCPDAVLPNTFHIRAKVSTPTTCTHPALNGYCSFVNWDQTLTDDKGHLFAANNNGDLFFIDYSASATKSIGDAGNYTKLQFLAVTLDDLVNAIAPPQNQPGGCPATKGFWHNHAWPSTSVNVGGVIYNGATHSMTIGGILYSAADVLSFLPTGSRAAAGGNGFRIGGSQLIAAILNIANGSPHSASLDATILAMNTALAGQDLRGSAPPNPLNNNLKNFGDTLDAYNSSASSLNCTEGASGN